MEDSGEPRASLCKYGKHQKTALRLRPEGYALCRVQMERVTEPAQSLLS